MRLPHALLPVAALLLAASPTAAEVPFPACSTVDRCDDASDYASYLFLAPEAFAEDVRPDDFRSDSGDAWKFRAETGMDIPGAWEVSTGRPDVFAAVLDSGIRWREEELARKIRLNTAELPRPAGCPASYDCNVDGVVNVLDFEGAQCAQGAVGDANRNGLLDPQDLIRLCSNGADEDGNGYVDDIAGWDFQQDDNDPFDGTDFGHGTGEGEDGYAEANDGSGFPGVAPSSTFVPLKVADSFIALDSDFQQAVVYAVDLGADLISEALGTLNADAGTQAAIDYAYERGVPLVASAADEESRHHNWPANFEHTLWVNSMVQEDGTLVQDETSDLLNGCTNYGGRAWVSIPSDGCSSEATGRAGGLVSLLLSHGHNLMDRGELAPYPGTDRPFSAEEVRQILRQSAEDVSHEGELDLSTAGILTTILSSAELGFLFGSERFPSQPGWDQFFGYGRPHAPSVLSVSAETIPPEADLSGGLRWFDVVDPERRESVEVVGSAAAVRTTSGHFDYTVEVGCGVQPKTWERIGGAAADGPLERAVLAQWDPAATADACGFDPSDRVGDPDDYPELEGELGEPDAHTVTLRLTVTDASGRVGLDRRTVAIDHDPTLRFPPIRLGGSGESSPALADLDRDGALDVIASGASGAVHALRGKWGEPLPGFPVHTDPIEVHPSPGYASGAVPAPREGVIGPVAAGDLNGDGRVEIAVASVEGKIYAWDDHGRRLPGFPVSVDPRFSAPEVVSEQNDVDPAITSAPTLADLDGADGDPALEIVATSWDGHVYAWNADGSPVEGFPVRLGDRSKLEIDAVTGAPTPIADGVRERGAKILSSPAVGDLDGDGSPEIVVATNEEYEGEPGGFAANSAILDLLRDFGEGLDLGDIGFDVQGRLYAVRGRGSAHPDGPFLPGWPAGVPVLAPALLPTVGTGTPGSPALADLDGEGRLTAAIFGIGGPAMLLEPDGSARLVAPDGTRRALALDFPEGGFPSGVPEGFDGSLDAPFIPALGSGAFGDLTGDGDVEYVAPTAGLRKLVDVLAPGRQREGDHQITAWNPRTGEALDAFPRRMDDMQFIASPGIADVDGDDAPDVLNGSGVYLVRAYRADGSVPEGWPKFTHGWMIASPTAGDVDGDGRTEVVAITRESDLFVWDTPASATEANLPWQGFGGDRRNTQNPALGVPRTAPATGPLEALAWLLESIRIEGREVAGGKPLLGFAVRIAGFAAEELREGRPELAFRALPWVELFLGVRPSMAPQHERLVDAVLQAARRSLEEVDCERGDASCRRSERVARLWLHQAEFHEASGRSGAAVRSGSRSLRASHEL